MNCPHQSKPPGKDTGRRLCAIGWAGGHPFVGDCQKCIAQGRNTPEAFQAAQEKHAKTHPEPFRGISGCCDNAKNYL